MSLVISWVLNQCRISRRVNTPVDLDLRDWKILIFVGLEVPITDIGRDRAFVGEEIIEQLRGIAPAYQVKKTVTFHG